MNYPVMNTALRASVLSLALTMAAGVSQAATSLTFIFTNAGGLSSGPTADCGSGCASFTATGVANDVPDTIPGSWDTSYSFTITRDTVNPLQGDIVGTFSYTDTSANGDDFSGSFTGTASLISGLSLGEADLSYTVTGGSGLFAGATGSGASTAYANITKLSLGESGYFNVSMVPEPGVWSMSALSLALIGFLGLRRKS